MHFLINKCLFSEEIPKAFKTSNNGIIFFEGKIPFSEIKYLHEGCGYVFGSINNINEVYTLNSLRHFLNFHFTNITVIDCLSSIASYYLNYKDSYFKLPLQLDYCDIGKFIKSNSGKKVLTGQILDFDLLNQIHQNQAGLIDSDLLFLAPKQDILREFRFWVMNDEIITYSEYSWDKNKKLGKIPEKAIETCKSVINYYTPDIFFTVDLVELQNGEFEVVEFNSFSTSGFYNCNVNLLIDAVKKYYSEEKLNHKKG